MLVFPGGDFEACRPIWQANRVQFAGRKGFLKLARGAQVPIVPMGIRGSHYTVPILWRSQRLLAWLLVIPRVFGIKRFPLTLLGVIGALTIPLALGPSISWPLMALVIWAWLASPFSLIPIVPASIRIRIGRPIAPEELFARDDDDLDEAYNRVVSAVQDLVTPAS